MKPLTSLVAAAALALTGAPPLRAQAANGSVEALAKKLAEDPGERAEAGKRLEAFLLNPDASGRSFVSADVDRAALGALARDWAVKADAGRLAALVAAAAPDSRAEARLRAALSAWTGSGQIKKTAQSKAAGAFLSDAADKASVVFTDQRSPIDASIEAHDRSAVPVPDPRESVERARRISGRRIAKNVFGPERAVQALGASGASLPGGPASEVPPAAAAAAPASPRAAPRAIAPAAQLPLSQGRPDGINVPAPVDGGGVSATGAGGVQASRSGQAGAPNDGRVAPAKPMSAWERIKDSVSNPLSDAYGFTFEGLEVRPVSFRDHAPALAYARKAAPGSFSKVTFYGHGAPGYMTVGEWGGDATDITSILKGKMRANATVDIKGCNTSSIGGASVNPGRGISGLTRRVLYFSVPYLTGDRSEASREQLENDWDSDLARDTSRGLPGVKVCGFRTFGLVGDRVPVLGTLMGRREATDSNAVLGTKACFIGGREVRP